MKITAIINPVAGAKKQRAMLLKLFNRLKNDGFALDSMVTSAPGDAQNMAEKAAKYTKTIIAVGGDGTICEIANGLAGSNIPMIVWPTGTENLFAKSLGYQANPESAYKCLKQGKIKPLDVGIVNRRSFLIVVGVGFDAEVVERLVKDRQGHITHLSYTGPIWRTFCEHRFPALTVKTRRNTIFQGRGMVFVGNMARYALGLNILRDAKPHDGLLDLCILPCKNRAQFIGHAIRTVFKKHLEHKTVIYQRLKHVRIDSPHNVPVQADGDAAGKLPIDVSIKPAAIRVLLPTKQ